MVIQEQEIDGIHIYMADITQLDINCDKTNFSDYRKQRLCEIKPIKAKKEAIGAELLLIHALNQHGVSIPANIEKNKNGKPLLKDETFHFSIAHSDGYVVCGIAKVNIGIDIEKTNRENTKLAEKYYTEKEREMNFTEVWCRKEAAVKADGRGISLGLSNFDVSDNATVIDGVTYKLYSINSPKGFMAAVAKEI